MRRHAPPVPEPDETDLNYITRVVDWLCEPDRRRLSRRTREHVLAAARRLKAGE